MFTKGRGSDKEPDVKSAPNMKVTLCKTYMYAEVETQSDNDLGLEDDESYEEGEVKEVCDIGCFGQQIGVATQKRENTSEREQDARKMQDQEKRMQLKSKLFLINATHSFTRLFCGLRGTENYPMATTSCKQPPSLSDHFVHVTVLFPS